MHDMVLCTAANMLTCFAVAAHRNSQGLCWCVTCMLYARYELVQYLA